MFLFTNNMYFTLQRVSTPLHELMHALGVFHEHTRPDRDDFITVNEENIPENRLRSFNVKAADSVNLHGTKYDYKSIMHYGRKVSQLY